MVIRGAVLTSKSGPSLQEDGCRSHRSEQRYLKEQMSARIPSPVFGHSFLAGDCGGEEEALRIGEAVEIVEEGNQSTEQDYYISLL